MKYDLLFLLCFIIIVAVTLRLPRPQIVESRDYCPVDVSGVQMRGTQPPCPRYPAIPPCPFPIASPGMNINGWVDSTVTYLKGFDGVILSW